jgi:hypothetical protein
MTEYPLLDQWWQETAEFEKISDELLRHDIFLLYGPPGIGKNTLIRQLESNKLVNIKKKTYYVDYDKISGITWVEKCSSLKKISQEKNARIIVKATTFDFFGIIGDKKTSERKDLSAYTSELKNWFENLSLNLKSLKDTDPYYYSLLISHADAEQLVDAIISSDSLKTTMDKETRNLLLRYARISTDDVSSLRLQKGKGYYFPTLLKKGVIEIRNPVTKCVDSQKLETFRKIVEQTKAAEQVLLPQPHLFPTVDLALVPFLWDAIHSPKGKLAGQVNQNFIQFLSSDANPLKKVLENVLVGVPIAGIGFAFLFYL